ncbi:MAG: 50S ribosomal protein L32 [Candidatus Levybacteria bacterium CG_4_10_14_0_2_um_filter_36_16]|nr:MAG: 50S ribosomal protein L32 [Candidatus Levybacteria bacterium CG2_30_37_29]PIR79649.1 MAG: 50S ribosomal protein L32 [Candidatus Levybacteria bacterium CG10_big_fil_rev_8_21_14_0_10_36_30]PIZ97749.1 MAG: 50S ribosomal protein L32 [Candidatus Levybacteria bacterium CG_4_10_14_0_2_um_filter_36_16]PJA90617.1 MAG: 50S ribosomal protein L32 [Candidatus Levybacteria bacterium CG_4_9_14_3_um_filter_36_7]
MPHEPKRRHSVARKGKRRASIAISASSISICKNCKTPNSPHTVCKTCGYYKGKKVIQAK